MKNSRYLCYIHFNNAYYAVFVDQYYKKYFLEIKDNKFILPDKTVEEKLNKLYNGVSCCFANRILEKKELKRIKILLFTLMFSLSGCKSEKTMEKSLEQSEEVTKNIFSSYIEDNKYLILNDYEEYKQYLSNCAPSYSLLYDTLNKNKNIPKKYKEVLTRIINLFEENEISSSNLGIFYENLKKLTVNTNYQANSSVVAYFIADPDSPCIYIDDEQVDFYTFLHEVTHSCHDVMIPHGDKTIYITNLGINKRIVYEEVSEINTYGTSYIEGRSECISHSLYKNGKRLFPSSNSYNVNNSILEFWVNTLEIDLNTLFSYGVKDFEKSLIQLGISKEKVQDIIHYMDILLISNQTSSIKSEDVNHLFYQNYTPALVEQYIQLGKSTDEIYKIIGTSLKTSVIEELHENNDLLYRTQYLNGQKKIFDEIDTLIKETLLKHNKETSSIYYYIGHEFQIYYELYGEEAGLESGKYYLAYNWDEVATENSNILLYVEKDTIKMGSYTLNEDGTLSCYDYNGAIKNIKNGIKLIDLLKIGAISIEDGYLKYNYPIESMIQIIENTKEEYSNRENNGMIIDNKYLILSNNTFTICNLTTNALGEDIAYHLFSDQIYLLPGNFQKIGQMQELVENNIISINENNVKINPEPLEKYLKESKDVKVKSLR